MSRLTRRDFLRASALGMGAVVVSSGLAGCGGSSSSRDDHRGNHLYGFRNSCMHTTSMSDV